MFFIKKPLLFYCSSAFLKIYDTHDKLHTVTFPSDVICFSEIVEESKLEKLLSDFIVPLNLQNAVATIVLSPELVFTEQLDTSVDDKQSQIDEIVAQIPITKTDITIINSVEASKSALYVTNKKLLELLEKVLSDNKIEVNSIVPVIVFSHLSKNNHLNIHSLRKGITNKKLVKQYNFLDKKKRLQSAPQEIKKKSLRKQYYLLILSLLALLLAITYLIQSFY